MALGCLKYALRSRVQADVVVYNVAISTCGKGRQWQQALSLLREVWNVKLEPDTIYITTPGILLAG